MALYTTQFVAGQVTGGPITSATVPGGHIWVVRSLWLWNSSGSSDIVQVAFVSSGVAGQWTSDGISSPILAETRTVLNEGDEIAVYTGGQQWAVNISGYDLTA